VRPPPPLPRLCVSSPRKEWKISCFRYFPLAASDVLSNISSVLIKTWPTSRRGHAAA
jgi:hypothetical protein